MSLPSADQLAEAVRRAAGEPARVTEHRASAYSEAKVGFIGEHWSLEVQLQRPGSSSATETLRLFVKTRPEGSKHADFVRESGLFLQEGAFLTKLLPLLLESCPKTKAFAPNCWLATDKLLVIEDLRSKGYGMLDGGLRQLAGQALCAAVRAQARLHAASLLTEARLGRPIDELCPESCVEHVFSEVNLASNRIALPLDLVARLGTRLGLEPARLTAALRRGFLRICRSRGRGKLGRVVSHGDTWPNNYLFDQSREPLGCVLVDFQLARYAPRMYDVAQLLYLGASRETRLREEAQVIRAYHQELCASLKANRPDLELPSLEELTEEYEDVRLSAMYAYVVYHPILGVNQKSLNDCDVGEFFLRVLFRQDNDALMETYDKDPEYLDGLLELVKELGQYCDTHEIPKEDYGDSEVAAAK